MVKIHDAIARALAKELQQRTAWDEQPQLYRLYLAGERPIPHLHPIDVPAQVWDESVSGLRQPETIDWVTYRMGTASLRDDDLHGVAFRNEGWAVLDLEHLSRFELGRIQQMGLDHQLKQHPRRVEVRMMVAVDRAGITYNCFQVRGREVRTIVSYPGQGVQLTGAVPEALDRMLAQLTGLPVLHRPYPDYEWKDRHPWDGS
jgi:hypothetical protein